MRTRRGKVIFLGAVLAAAGIAASIFAQNSRAQDVTDPIIGPVPPTPFELVSNLDLACHTVEGGETPVRSLEIDHLNPVLRKMGLEPERAYLGRMTQLCAPVAKNEVMPPRAAYNYVRWIDLACYEARSETWKEYDIALSHLNPVLREMGLPPEKVVVGPLRQVCVPVAKNGVTPPSYVLPVVAHIDVACYEIRPTQETRPFRLTLDHLNPVIQESGLERDYVYATMPEQLCVPVAKNGRIPPDAALKFVQWIDFKKYEAQSRMPYRPIPLKLSHLNPQFEQYRPFGIEMLAIDQLAVPVAKNGVIPPGNDDIGPVE